MHKPMLQIRMKGAVLAALAGTILAGQSTFAQSPDMGPPTGPVVLRLNEADSQVVTTAQPGQPPQIAQTPQSPTGRPDWRIPDYGVTPAPSGASRLYGGPMPPSPSPTSPYSSVANQLANEPQGTQPSPTQVPTNTAADFSAYGSPFAGGDFGAGGGATTAMANPGVGYIDSAIVRSNIRVRFDANYDDTSPDKAEFFYAKCGCFASPVTFNTNRAMWDPHARGPEHRPGPGVFQFSGNPKLNYQELSAYLEYAPTMKFSGFIEMPARFIQAVSIRDTAGFSDVNLGFKYALLADPNYYYTFQFRTYTPTGAANLGLGTGHVSFEPALLVFHRLTDRLYFNGEFRDWIPVGGSDFAGNILRYGLGLTYNIVLTDRFRVAPVNEVVGWTILSGKEFVQTTEMPLGVVMPVAGQTIVNEKIGLRFGLGDYSNAGGGSAVNDRHSLYVGYGRALTGDHWYRDTFRLEYNFWF
jgi:hypothetical protein